MCGVVGLIDQVEGKVPDDLLSSMLEFMTHRGPDGEGRFVEGPVGMGMRRLSIIDLAGGWQPFFSGNGNIVAFQNGEIYNYEKLKKELLDLDFIFKSDSDTEVLAHGYAAWGIERLLEKLDGMYAIAILDRGKGELHLVRDRFGEKPLYYAATNGRFAYSSDLVTLAALPWVGEDINLLSLERYLALHYCPGEATILKSVQRILPGERVVVPIHNPVPKKFPYYKIPAQQTLPISENELAEALEQAVSSRLVADVPVGVFLSGGLDSSVLAAIAGTMKPNISTFSMGFDSETHDESPYAKAVAERIGSNHYHFQFDENAFVELLPAVASALDEPVGDQAMLPLYWLCREARKHVTVALAGEGADEVFGGYGYYRAFLNQTDWKTRLKQWVGKAPKTNDLPSRLIHNSIPVTPSGFPLLTDVAGRQRLLDRELGQSSDTWEEHLIVELFNLPALKRATLADLKTWLPDDLLVKFDRIAMSHSLEGRAPFLHPKIVEMGLNISEQQRMNPHTSKVLLRQVARRYLPDAILSRPKQGFVLPMKKWLNQWLKNQESVRFYFMKLNIPGLNTEEVIKVVEEDLKNGIQRERLIFALLMLAEWHKSFQDRKTRLRDQYLRNI